MSFLEKARELEARIEPNQTSISALEFEEFQDKCWPEIVAVVEAVEAFYETGPENADTLAAWIRCQVAKDALDRKAEEVNG